MNHFTQVIEDHLKAFAKEDPAFAEKFSAKMKSDKNSINQCCAYIISEVRKSKRQAFADEEIYGMAIHYFDEDMTYTQSADKCRVVTPKTGSAPKEEKVAKPAKTRKAPVEDESQLSLF